MRMDLTVTGYPTYADLERYMYGSAAVIGLLMVPILEPVDDAAYLPARALGEAFQLTNFIRDVGEDLRRGRVYLPEEDLARFEVTRADLARPTPNDRVKALLRFEIDRTRALYREAAPGIALLHPTSRDCVATALRLYGGILDAVERSGYDVLSTRVTVPVATRLRVAAPAPASCASRPPPSSPDRGRLRRRPHHTHQARVCTTSENPNSRSSTGAYASRSSGNGVLVVGHDVAPGEPPVGHQLEDHDDRVGGPERPAGEQPGAQDGEVQHDCPDHPEDSQRGVAHRSSPTGQPRTRRTASSASTEQIGMTRKNSSSSTGRPPGSVTPIVWSRSNRQWPASTAYRSHTTNTGATQSRVSARRRHCR